MDNTNLIELPAERELRLRTDRSLILKAHRIYEYLRSPTHSHPEVLIQTTEYGVLCEPGSQFT